MSAALGTFENPRPYDILCGRNRGSFNNIGNRRFRITISMNVEKYNALPSRHERSKFIASLAQTLRYEVGFRFLKRTTCKNNKKKKSTTEELSDEEIRAKVGHALRDLSTAMQQQKADGEQATPESKVPRPGPYKTQDKTLESPLPPPPQQQEPLRRVVSLSGSASSSFGADNKKPSSSSLNPMPSTREEQPTMLGGSADAPDRIPSSIHAPLHLMPLLRNEEEARRLLEEEDDNDLDLLETKIKEMEQDNQVFPLDIGSSCESLLMECSPTHFIPSHHHHQDNEEDCFEMLNDFSWRTDPIDTMSGRSMARSTISYDMMSVESHLSDTMDTLSLIGA